MTWLFTAFLIWGTPDGYSGSYTSEETYLTQEECELAMMNWAYWSDEFGDDLIDYGASCETVIN